MADTLASFDLTMAPPGVKLQANLYLSSQKRQGFQVHFDTHDVFAVHVMGEKTWMVYEGHSASPIAHPLFENLPPNRHEKVRAACGRRCASSRGIYSTTPGRNTTMRWQMMSLVCTLHSARPIRSGSMSSLISSS